MKQHITKKQLLEYLEVKSKFDYNEEKYRKLYSLVTPKAVVEETFTIGNMIKILDSGNYSSTCVNGSTSALVQIMKRGGLVDANSFNHGNLCDALWEAVKYVLESSDD